MKKNIFPSFHISKRTDATLKQKCIYRSVTILVALIISILYILIVSGKNPFIAIGYIFNGTFKWNDGKFSKNIFYASLKDIVVLLGIAIALAPAYKMKFWNIGAQGQILMGGLFTAIIMIYCSKVPNALVIPLSLVCALLAGALWGLIPAIFKAKFNTNETLFTLMMNYVAIQIVTFCTETWRGTKSSMGKINQGTKLGWLPKLGGTDVLLPFIVVTLLVIGMYFYIKKSKHGYEIQVIGESVNTAKYAGIKVDWVILRTMALSGALCGLIGYFYVAGFAHTISATSTGGGYGFTAIIVCWLASFNPFIMPLFSFLIVFLTNGAKNLSNINYSKNLNDYSCETIIFIIILSIMVSEFMINYELHVQNKPKWMLKVDDFFKEIYLKIKGLFKKKEMVLENNTNTENAKIEKDQNSEQELTNTENYTEEKEDK